jgi:ribonuclease T1
VFRTGLASSGKALRREILRWGAALVVVSGLGAGGAQARESADFSSTSAQVTLASLPPEAQTTHQRVLNGGPFPYAKDGIVFGNRERLLPAKARGYYREYTVKTPGATGRGARRIVCGGTPPSQPEACYYTADHYSSFRRIQQ